MEITESARTRRQAVEYDVEFRERRLEDIAARLNRFERDDEKPFEAVAAISEFNQRAYELFARPLVQATSQRDRPRSSSREFHPLRVAALGDLRPQSVARVARARRARPSRRSARRSAPTTPLRKVEKARVGVDQRVARLLPRDARRGRAKRRSSRSTATCSRSISPTSTKRGSDAATAAPSRASCRSSRKRWRRSREGGYRRGVRARRRSCSRARTSRLPLSRLQHAAGAGRGLCATCCPSCRSTNGAASAASRRSSLATSPSRRSTTLPDLLRDAADRERLLTLLERVLADKRVHRTSADRGADGDV